MELNDLKNICLRSIPSVESILNHELTEGRFIHCSRRALVEGVRKVLDQKRKWILSQNEPDKLQELQGDIGSLLDELEHYIQNIRFSELGKVINGTGIILHTNLGRAVLPQAVVKKLSIISSHYSNLEFDLLSGKRGRRGASIVHLLRQITGAEDALVVNNNAAAVLLALNTLAKSQEVIVSRGELVEIGGSFRIPEILKEGGARLVEVGTTNKTRLKDYRRAINPESIAILKVHPSNFQILGFTEEVSLSELVALGQDQGLLVIYDLGSGVMLDLAPYGLKVPVVSQVVQQGPDIITFSGDKLLGGPQAGIILCKQKYAKALRENPLARALRPDKMTLFSLENTLKIYQEPDAVQKIPCLQMITASRKSLEKRGKQILEGLQDLQGREIHIEIIDDKAELGGGAFSIQKISSLSVAISLDGEGINQLAEQLRLGSPPILGRIHQNQFRLNLHTIQQEDIREIINNVRQALSFI